MYKELIYLNHKKEKNLLWVELCLLKRYTEVLTSSNSKCDFIWKWGCCMYNEMPSYWSRVGLSPNMTAVFIRREETQRLRGQCHVMVEAEWSEAAAIWGTRITSKTSELGGSKERFSPTDFRVQVALPTPLFWTSSLQTLRQCILLLEAPQLVVLCYGSPRS